MAEIESWSSGGTRIRKRDPYCRKCKLLHGRAIAAPFLIFLAFLRPSTAQDRLGPARGVACGAGLLFGGTNVRDWRTPRCYAVGFSRSKPTRLSTSALNPVVRLRAQYRIDLFHLRFVETKRPPERSLVRQSLQVHFARNNARSTPPNVERCPAVRATCGCSCLAPQDTPSRR
jgi:hypothetical protein